MAVFEFAIVTHCTPEFFHSLTTRDKSEKKSPLNQLLSINSCLLGLNQSKEWFGETNHGILQTSDFFQKSEDIFVIKSNEFSRDEIICVTLCAKISS